MDCEDLLKWCVKKGKSPIVFACVSPALLKNYKLVFNHLSSSREAGAANIMESKGDKVYGLLCLVKEEDRAKIRNKEGSPNIYKEISNLTIETLDGRVITDAFTFKLKKDKEKPNHQSPTRYYLDLLIGNARKYNFPSTYIDYLKSFDCKD